MIATECCDSCDNFTEMDAGNYPTCLVDKKHFKRKLMGSRCDLYTPRNPIENPLEKDLIHLNKIIDYQDIKINKLEKMWEELKIHFIEQDPESLSRAKSNEWIMNQLEKENGNG